jgi:outer membrane protein TolC
VELTWPLFDGFGREGELIAERARLKQREIELQDAQQGVFLDVLGRRSSNLKKTRTRMWSPSGSIWRMRRRGCVWP